MENFYPDGDNFANVKKEEKGEEGGSTNKDEIENGQNYAQS